MSDGEYGVLQRYLIDEPDRGDIIKGSGGIRKLRWKVTGRGKRGGARVIYYWAVRRDTILMLTVYSKSERDDLAADELKAMARVVEAEFHG